MKQLEAISSITAIDVFNGSKSEELVSGIEKEARSFIPDLSTDKSRKEIASLSAKVSKSKVVLDNLGKRLVSKWKSDAKLVDNERKMIRDRLDSLRDEVRQPLTKWEHNEKEKQKAKQLEKELLDCQIQAILENDLFDRQKEIERKEAEQIKIEAEKVVKAELERIKSERIEREKEIAVEAAEKAKNEAEEKAAKEKEKAEQEIINAKTAVKMEKLKAIEAAELAERDKIQAVKDAEEKEKQKSIDAEIKRRDEEASEQQRLDNIKAEEERKAANKNHQAKINRHILKQLKTIGLTDDQSKLLITAIVKKEIDYISIQY